MAHDTLRCSLAAVEKTQGKDTRWYQPVRPEETPEGHAVEKQCEVERKRQTEWPAVLNLAESLSNSWGQ